MSPLEIKTLVEKALSELTIIPWWSYILMVIAPLLGVYFGSYLKKKAENKVIREDYKSILKHIENNTKAAESIKTELAQGFWLDQQSRRLKEKYYLELISSFSVYKESLSLLLDYYQQPGSEHSEKSIQKIDGYKLQSERSSAAFETMEKIQGPVELILHEDVVNAWVELKARRWEAFNHIASHEKEYLDIVFKATNKAYEVILKKAKTELLN